ncbi:uro-adherence factor A-like isoform X2 [Ptychodera flava]|uniref:uro-adherence factor A-like isoform X2 n=1 Tax=Ptychodera flava TaxID=63121 RepID=UPI003969FAD2
MSANTKYFLKHSELIPDIYYYEPFPNGHLPDLHPTERLYRKIVKPSLGILNIDSHTSRHRIRLHSSFQPRMQGQLYTLKNRPRTEPTDSLVQTFPRLTDALVGSPEFSSNFVYSYNSQVQDDLANLNRSSTPQSFNSTTKVKQLPLPSVSPTGRTVSSVSPSRGIKSVSICSDRYLGTHSKLSREGKSEGVSSLKARSEQQRRFEIESRAKLKSRALKRTSEIIPHRVDRTYYMSGASVPLKNKYLVDNEELERLKELSRSRSSRSLRASQASRGDQYLADRQVLDGVPAIANSEITDTGESSSTAAASTTIGVATDDKPGLENGIEKRAGTASSRSTEDSDSVAGARVRFKAAGSSSAKASIPGNLEEDKDGGDQDAAEVGAEGGDANDEPQEKEDGYDSGVEQEPEDSNKGAKVEENKTSAEDTNNTEEPSETVNRDKQEDLFMTEYREDNQVKTDESLQKEGEEDNAEDENTER